MAGDVITFTGEQFAADAPPVRFGIWSDSPMPADQLRYQLRDLAQQAIIVSGGSACVVDCLVVIMHEQLGPAELADLLGLANQAAMTVSIEVRSGATRQWPREATLQWNGQVGDLPRIATALVRLVPPSRLLFPPYPALLAVPHPLPNLSIAADHEALVAQLCRPDRPRIIPVTTALFQDLVGDRRATDPMDYDLRRVARWAADERRRAIVNLRLAAAGQMNLSLTRPLSLADVVNDRRTHGLILLLGEPGAGKTLQLRYFDAYAALRSIRQRDATVRMNSFYIPLAEQPATPDISFAWLASRWEAAVDTTRWCDLEQFLRDGAMILLDGLNEGGVRTLPLNQWMVRWRDVIGDLFRREATKVTVSCRTRDQIIRMRAPGDQPPTAVTILPLSREAIVTIATDHSAEAGARLDEALARDPSLVELYSNLFRLNSFLQSGASQVADTEARLFGAAISAAIVHEWERDNLQEPLIPPGSANELERVMHAGDDPWPLLESMPLIRGLGELAKQLTAPARLGGRARLTMPPRDAEALLGRTVGEAVGQPIDPRLIVNTARDLHVLTYEPTKVRFTHPSMQHLFAAVGTTLDELVKLADRELPDPAVRPHTTGDNHNASSYPLHRYDEVFQFAAQLRGAEVAERLLSVDPVLATRVYRSIRAEADPVVADRIKRLLLSQLRGLTKPVLRSAHLTALGDLGWMPPSTWEGGATATALVPAQEWQLGDRDVGKVRADRSVSSEVRTIRLREFRISRFPVSNGEFERFVQDGGYENKSLWTPEGWEWRTRSRAVDLYVSDWQRRQEKLRSEYPHQVIRLLRCGIASPVDAAALVRFATMSEEEFAEHARTLQARPVTAPRYWLETALRNRLQPVVGVSWFEANAFCAWLSRSIGAETRLPSENEWEAACLFSWDTTTTAEIGGLLGSEFGNTIEFPIAATTPIGAFAAPDQERRQRPVEMLGNVFEWTFDYYAPGSHNRRTTKGGSWRQDSWRAHPAYRGRSDVNDQNDDLGFRYVITERST